MSQRYKGACGSGARGAGARIVAIVLALSLLIPIIVGTVSAIAR